MNITKLHLAAAMSAVLAALGSPAAWAADFAFTIPLQIQNLHEGITGASILCQLIGKKRDGQNGVIGARERTVALDSSTGNAQASEIVIAIDVDRNVADPRDATHYRCTLYLSTPVRRFLEILDITQVIEVLPPQGGGQMTVPVADRTKAFRSLVRGAILNP